MAYLGAGVSRFTTADGLTVSGNATVSGTTALTGNATAAGNLNVTGNIDVDGTTDLDGLTVAGNLSVDGGTIKLDGNYPTGTANVALGNATLDSLTDGGYNTAIGTVALTANTSGVANTGVGYGALDANTTANYNVAIGYDAIGVNTTGTALVGIGSFVLDANTTASHNTGVGYAALTANTTGTQNTAVGSNVLDANTTASRNTAVGYEAGTANTTGHVTAIGSYVLRGNTTGSANVGVGGNDESNGGALQKTTTGSNNTAVGVAALTENTTGSENTAVGTVALDANTTGTNNNAHGFGALGANTTGSYNVAIGRDAGATITTTDSGTFVGAGAGQNSTSSDHNTYIGRYAGGDMTSGAKNTIIGRYAGNAGGVDIRTSSNKIVLSDGDGNPRLWNDAERWRISNSGVATFFPNTSSASGTNGIVLDGHTGSGGGYIGVTGGATLLYLDRNASDGDMVVFYQAGSAEGSISVSGTTVSYNGGHLSRWSQATDGNRINGLLKGTVMTNLDQMAKWTKDGVTEDNEQLNCMAVSSVEGDPNVAGVFVNWDDDDKEYTADMNIAMTGDMVIRIAQGTTVARGDLLMSAGDGTAKPQDDDIVRSKTIAKVTSTNVSHTYDDKSYCVPCVLMAC